LINRFYLKDYLSFENIDIEFGNKLVVFTGESGAGKSILMNAIISLFGINDTKPLLSEISIDSLDISYEEYAIDKNEEFVIKQTNIGKTRFLLNNQTISKKNLNSFGKTFCKHLHLKDISDFQSENIVKFLDFLSLKNDKEFKILLEDFKQNFRNLEKIKQELEKINKDEQDVEQLKSYAKFQIDKIISIDPKINEYDELKKTKDNLSKKEKIEDALKKCTPFLQNSHYISSTLQLLGKSSNFFDDTINEINAIFEKFNDEFANLEDYEIEQILTRLENLSSLQKQYGSIQNALDFKKQKELELEKLDNILFEKAILEKNIKKLTPIVEQLSLQLTNSRKKHINLLQQSINEYLKLLYLDGLKITLSQKKIDITGCDMITFTLNNTNLDKISSGEFNRLRLALLTAQSKYQFTNGGVLFLDEIDANLSGKESQSIAQVLSQLSKSYQIFAISHQPQLSATANEHFLIQKHNNISTVKLLNKDERISEISRMISGENITKEAIVFAKELLKNY
jgi:DNA repair protein RecN (Recombination protein N)